MLSKTQEKAISLINRAKKILCVTQIPAHADGICSLLALQEVLKKQKKEVITILPEGLPHQYNFLPGSKEYETELGEKGNFVISLSTEKAEVERVKYTIEDNSVDIIVTPKSGSFSANDVDFKHHLAHFDLIITMDCPSLEKLGPIFKDNTEIFSNYPILNIGSDPLTQDFGTVNLIDLRASSSSEILFDLLKNDGTLNKTLDGDIATTILSGIIISTGSFLKQSVSPASFQAASELQALGAEQSSIIDHFFKQKSLATLKIWGKIFNNLQLDPIHRIAWSHISQSDLANFEATGQDIDAISDEILRFIQPVDYSVLLIEDEKTVTAQVRSQQSETDWDQFKSHFDFAPSENGINTTHEGDSLAEAESNLLHFIINLQKERLNIDYELPIQRADIKKMKAENHLHTEINLAKSETEKPVQPTPPASIPFDAPFQPHENAESKPKETQAPAAKAEPEIKKEPPQKGIPEWLKKSFPDN